MRPIITLLFILIITFVSSGQSVLSEGNFYKIGVVETGLYKIDRSFLSAIGLSVDQIDPRNIKLFGNSVNGALSQANSAARPFDLLENAIYVEGGEDGILDEGDFILFYAKGTDKKKWTSSGFEYEHNIYADTSYYFISHSDDRGKRVAFLSNPDIETATEIKTFDEAISHEEDEVNIISSGRNWLDETLSDGESMNFSYTLEGIASDISMEVAFANRSGGEGTFEINANNTSIGTITLNRISTGVGSTYSIKARYAQNSFLIPQNNSLDLTFAFSAEGDIRRGHLDFFVLTYKKDLSLITNELQFRSTESDSIAAKYIIENASGATVWNVTDPSNALEQETAIEGSRRIFINQSNQVDEFVAFTGSDFPSPFLFGRVKNQHIKENISVDGLIITTPELFSEAQRLADFRLQNDQLNVKVVLLREVYNEFSSGRQDITAIRDYAKYVYENGSLQYLLLFGDCSYDYKDRITGNTNIIPTYQSRESFDPVSTYSSDDYYGFFEESEGDWIERDNNEGNHTLEIGVGRLPAKNASEAKILVDKIIHYSTSPLTLGKWRNDLTYVADDGDGNGHAEDAEDLSSIVDINYPRYKINKLLLDIYDQVEVNANTENSPEAEAAFENKIKEGTFLVNFMGHGNESRWMDESMLTKEMIRTFNNRNKLPIFVTATCEFGRYDNPRISSGAEDLILNENGGAIALLTTSRPVFRFSNFDLNEAFHLHMFAKVDGEHQRLGDIMLETKNNSLRGANNRNFTLLGDPMMMPSFPEYEISIESTSELDTLSALEKITFKGVIGESSSVLTNFNGTLDAVIRDVPQEFLTVGQESDSDPFTYTNRSNIIFNGQATVTDGEFEFSFVVPKNISYQFETGRLSLYASDTENNLDATGESSNIVIGGTFSSSDEDNSPPNVALYLNDRSFQSGAQVGNSPLLIAEINDENGITTASSGVVDGISLLLNDQFISLNEFYTSSLDDFTSGTIVYPLSNLDPGTYSAKLRVWDTHNNASESTITFVVSENPLISIYDEKVYPNPAFDKTTFIFNHDRVEEDLIINLNIFNAKGEIVNSQTTTINNSDRTVSLDWQLDTDSGKKLEHGVYYYRMSMKSRTDGAENEITGRILISR